MQHPAIEAFSLPPQPHSPKGRCRSSGGKEPMARKQAILLANKEGLHPAFNPNDIDDD
jgi:hypothetical protein